MKENFEIEKELKFNSNIAEVTSISLEEKHEIVDEYLVGNFVVSGDYRIHEISLNKEKFNYKIPFKHQINNDIDEKTAEIEVTNFIYDTDNDSLFVTINYDLVGDRKDILLFDDEENLEEFLKSREVEFIMDDVTKEIDDVLEKNDKDIDIPALKNEIKEEIVKVIDTVSSDDVVLLDESKEITKDVVNDRNMEESKEKLLNSVNVSDDNYITYKIHIVKAEDSLESILVNYKISLDELKEYNDFNTLQLGDKLIIPIINEE